MGIAITVPIMAPIVALPRITAIGTISAGIAITGITDIITIIITTMRGADDACVGVFCNGRISDPFIGETMTLASAD